MKAMNLDDNKEKERKEPAFNQRTIASYGLACLAVHDRFSEEVEGSLTIRKIVKSTPILADMENDLAVRLIIQFGRHARQTLERYLLDSGMSEEQIVKDVDQYAALIKKNLKLI